ncbi:hypothetical protein BMF94_5004 [Rhodotorula taiwanensis]|uniref:Uncharacterized protein n=1 Tax=Rhodotorula taiwanensis TaxID=741276 RepID=A0A2S5B5I1_9BASI|nr:hypothetical protein BMF94_5004 [Rhodotorula taiwanensis]
MDLPWPAFHPGAGLLYPVHHGYSAQLVQLSDPAALEAGNAYALQAAYLSQASLAPIPSTSQSVATHRQPQYSRAGGSVRPFEPATYASGIPGSPAPDRTVIRGYDDFPLHAGPYEPYGTYPLSTPAEAYLPIAQLPPTLAANRPFQASHPSASAPRHSLNRPAHSDLRRASSSRGHSSENGSDSAKRRYSQYGPGSATPERGSVQLVQDAHGSASLKRVRARQVQQDEAVADPATTWNPVPRLAQFAPAVPLWPAEEAHSVDAHLWYSQQTGVPTGTGMKGRLSIPCQPMQDSKRLQDLPEPPHATSTQLGYNDGPPPALGDCVAVGNGRSSPPVPIFTPQLSSPASPGYQADSSANEDELASVVALASIRRALHSSRPPPLASKASKASHKARNGTTPLLCRPPDHGAEQFEEERVLRERGRVNSTQQKRVASIEVLATCVSSNCGRPLARLVLRSIPEAIASALDSGLTANDVVRFSLANGAEGCLCLACSGLTRSNGTVKAADQSDAEESGGYKATLSAAVDRLEQVSLDPVSTAAASSSRASDEPQTATDSIASWESLPLINEARLPAHLKTAALRCDICAYICGFGAAESAIQHHGEAEFTVEVICARCDALFKCCSDCGGGGGRLTPGRWRSKELFPEGRKTCQLSHARNPALGEVSIDVLPIESIPPDELAVLEAQTRSLYFNTRLAVIARPEYLISGDGLARTFDEVERVTVDHWNIFSNLLQEEVPPDRNIRRYLTMMYSTPRKRHSRKTVKKPRGSFEPLERVPFGFAISEADYRDSTLCFCVVMPWPINGQAFDAVSMMGELTTQRAKLDLRALNQQRVLANPPLPRMPPLRYNYTLSPFRVGSHGNATLSRRGFEPLEDLARRDPQVDLSHFPPIKAMLRR